MEGDYAHKKNQYITKNIFVYYNSSNFGNGCFEFCCLSDLGQLSH